MDKISSALELQDELRKLLAYAGTKNPSRQVVARDLKTLMTRLATNTRQKTAAVSRSLVQQEALKVMRKVRPTNRAQTVKALAKALTQSSVFMDYLKESTAQYGFDGHTLPDLLGEVMWDYRNAWEIPDDDEWEELSADPVLTHRVEKAVADWEPRGSQLYGWDTLDFAELEGLVGRLGRAVVELKRARDQANGDRVWINTKLSAAQVLVKQISKVLSDDLRGAS